MKEKIYEHDTFKNMPIGVEYDFKYNGQVYKHIRKPCPLCGYVVTHETNERGYSCGNLDPHYLYQCKEHPYRIFFLAKELMGEKDFYAEVFAGIFPPQHIQKHIKYYADIRQEIKELDKRQRELI